MAMDANLLKTEIQSKFNPAPDNADDANRLLGEALRDHIINNCEITYAWVAVDSATGTPDPISSFTATPSYVSFLLTPSADFRTWFISLSGAIQTAILNAETQAPPFVFPLPLTFGIIPLIGVQSGLSDPDAALLDVCNQIITGIKKMVNLSPNPGTRGTYVGTASMASII